MNFIKLILCATNFILESVSISFNGKDSLLQFDNFMKIKSP